HTRTGRECGTRADRDRQGRSEPASWPTPNGSWFRDEPERSPARWWGRQGANWWPAEDEVGQTGLQGHPAQQASRFNDCSTPAEETAVTGAIGHNRRLSHE